MISEVKAIKLIRLYEYVCQLYESELKYYCMRYSNNSRPLFTDEEILTVYLFTGHCQRCFQLSDMYDFAHEHLLEWFPRLVSYQTFNYRLNRLSEPLRILCQRLVGSFRPEGCDRTISIVDSLPIITCLSSRHGKVASEITTKGYCSTKNLYYYGLKLHALAFRRKGRLPFPESFALTPAEDNDLTVFKQNWGESLTDRSIFGDKIYQDAGYFSKEKYNRQNMRMMTPVRGVRGQSQRLKEWDKAANDLFSASVSSIRQPIEALFNWLIEKTNIQRASKVRSTSGLIVHIMGKIAIAFIYLIF